MEPTGASREQGSFNLQNLV
uniref:Uncharacterized protein n=1 Tax=Anguilla anguilla TaxID=7936 RepID=A0A0E9PLF7_ANGAN